MLKTSTANKTINKNRRQHTNNLANVNFPEITGGHANKVIFAFPSFCKAITKHPKIQTWAKNREVV